MRFMKRKYETFDRFVRDFFPLGLREFWFHNMRLFCKNHETFTEWKFMRFIQRKYETFHRISYDFCLLRLGSPDYKTWDFLVKTMRLLLNNHETCEGGYETFNHEILWRESMRLFIEFSMTFASWGLGLLTSKHETFTTIYRNLSAWNNRVFDTARAFRHETFATKSWDILPIVSRFMSDLCELFAIYSER